MDGIVDHQYLCVLAAGRPTKVDLQTGWEGGGGRRGGGRLVGEGEGGEREGGGWVGLGGLPKMTSVFAARLLAVGFPAVPERPNPTLKVPLFLSPQL